MDEITQHGSDGGIGYESAAVELINACVRAYRQVSRHAFARPFDKPRESTFEVVRPYFKERGKKPMGEDHPVSWIRIVEGGRIFYTALGHDVRSLDTDFGRQHILGGIHWAAGTGS